MLYNDQSTNPFLLNDNNAIDDFPSFKLHPKYIPDGLDYLTVYSEQERMFKRVRHTKTQEIFSKYKDIIKANTDNKDVDNADNKDVNNADSNDINNDNNHTNTVCNNTNGEVKNLNIFENINLLSNKLKEMKYENKELLKDVLNLRKMYSFESQKMLKERILPFLQESLTNEQLLSAIKSSDTAGDTAGDSESNKTKLYIKDALEIIEIEKEYKKEVEKKEKESEKEKRSRFCKEICEVLKMKKEHEKKEYEKVKKTYFDVFLLHNKISEGKDLNEGAKSAFGDNIFEEPITTEIDQGFDDEKVKRVKIEVQENLIEEQENASSFEAKSEFLKRICSEKIGKRQRISIFMEMPNKKEYPDYYKTIKNPLSVNSIKRKIKLNNYTLNDLKCDLLLMFDNALEYNSEGSEVYKDAIYYKEYIDKMK